MTKAEPSELERLAAADRDFVAGDFAAVRAEAALLSRSLDVEVRKKAGALRARVSVDPVAILVWSVAFLFFVGVCARYLGGS